MATNLVGRSPAWLPGISPACRPPGSAGVPAVLPLGGPRPLLGAEHWGGWVSLLTTEGYARAFMTPAPCEAPGLGGGAHPEGLSEVSGGSPSPGVSARGPQPTCPGRCRPPGPVEMGQWSQRAAPSPPCGSLPHPARPALLSLIPRPTSVSALRGLAMNRGRGGTRGPAPRCSSRQAPMPEVPEGGGQGLCVCMHTPVCVQGSVCMPGMCLRLRAEAHLSPHPAPSSAHSSRPGIPMSGRALPGHIPSSPNLGLEPLGVPWSEGSSPTAWPRVEGGVRAACSQALLRTPGGPQAGDQEMWQERPALDRCPGLRARRGASGHPAAPWTCL